MTERVTVSEALEAIEQAPVPHPLRADIDWSEVCIQLYEKYGGEQAAEKFMAAFEREYCYQLNKSEKDGLAFQILGKGLPDDEDRRTQTTDRTRTADPVLPVNQDENTIVFTSDNP